MKHFFEFGEKNKQFPVRVLNEREVRAASGILFLVAIITFVVSCMTRNFTPLKVFVVAFLIDFIIRVLINPKFSPTMIMGRFFVKAQVPEYVGAPQKRFAWGIGLGIAVAMFILLFVSNYFGPVNMLFCLLCLVFLFFETAFGICIGCWLYNMFNKEHAKLCPGGVCAPHKREPIVKLTWVHLVIVILFFVVMIALVQAGVFSSSSVSLAAGMGSSATMTVNSGLGCGGSDCLLKGNVMEADTASPCAGDCAAKNTAATHDCPFR